MTGPNNVWRYRAAPNSVRWAFGGGGSRCVLILGSSLLTTPRVIVFVRGSLLSDCEAREKRVVSSR
jgi:hypothetical protein